MPKVVHVQKDVLSGGRAALRLHEAFLDAGIESFILSLFKDINDSERVIKTGKLSRIVAKTDYKVQSILRRKINPDFGLYSFPLLGTNISKLSVIREADLVYLNWVQGGFLNLSNYSQLFRLGKPVVLVMHDMWTITGGCHHSFTCLKYTSRCKDCPMFAEGKLIDWPEREFLKKYGLYKKSENIYFVSPSKWLYNCSKNSFLLKGKPIFHIPNVVNSKIFKPVDRKFARQILNINQEEHVIGFGAMSINSPYKGWEELKKALLLLRDYRSDKKLSVLIFGGEYNKTIADSIPFRTHFLGFLKDEYSTSLVFNALDVFVSPSLADNLPTTILECLSCGTPVTGFNVGGIPDMIDHEKNGYLAKYRDSEDLALGIRFCIESKIKGWLLPEFEKGNIMKKHLELFDFIKK